MAERLGLAIIPGVGWTAREVQAVAREAEGAGFDAIFAAEVNNDVMATAQLMGAATERIRWARGLRTSTCAIPTCAPRAQPSSLTPRVAASFSGWASAIRPSTERWGSTCPIRLRCCGATSRRRAKLAPGRGPADPPAPATDTASPCRSIVAAVTSRTVELGGELADGIMPFLWSAARVAKSKAWVDRGRAKVSGLGKVDVTLGLPTFIGDDVKAMRDAARQNLGLYTTFPFFQRLFRASGFDGGSRSDGEGSRRRLAERPSAGCGLPARAARALPTAAGGLPRSRH